MSVCVSVCVCMFVCVLCICVCMIHVCVSAHVCVFVYVRYSSLTHDDGGCIIYMGVRLYVCLYIEVSVCVCVCVCSCVCLRLCVYECLCVLYLCRLSSSTHNHGILSLFGRYDAQSSRVQSPANEARRQIESSIISTDYAHVATTSPAHTYKHTHTHKHKHKNTHI